MTLIDHYFDLQKKYENQYGRKTVVFLEKGMFYEIYSVDNDTEKIGLAHIISKYLNIQLTKSNKKVFENNRQNPFMTGFPVVSLHKNLKILIENGYTIVTYDQQKNNPSERSITNIFSPGTYIDEHNSSHCNYISSMYIEKTDEIYIAGISFIELSTGKSYVFEKITNDRILFFEDINRMIESYNSVEYSIILSNISENMINNELNSSNKLFHFNSNYSDSIFDIEYQNQMFEQVYTQNSQLSLIEQFDLEKLKYATISFINLLQFCFEHNNNVLKCIDPPIIIDDTDRLILHNNAIYQLNIISLGKKVKGITSLLDIVDNTSTPMGRRLLKHVIVNPITSVDKLSIEYDKIDTMIHEINWYEDKLKLIIDIERYHRKLALCKIKPVELSNLNISYENIHIILNNKNANEKITILFNEFYKHYINTFNLGQMKIMNTNDITDNIFNKGVSDEIDLIQEDIQKIKDKLNNECNYLSNLLNQKENIIKFEFSQKTGYYLHTTGNRGEQIQKIVKDKYFFKKESKTKCIITSDKINKWIDSLSRLQNNLLPSINDLYQKIIREYYIKYNNMFNELNTYIAEIDLQKSKAKTAKLNDYCRPYIKKHEESYIKAENMRHAIIECLDTDCDYVPNDINIDSENIGILLYGVNGSGKSCYSKAIGLCIVLAQSGHYVPCSVFEFSPFTKLYTRITGDDNIFRGHSSFFVEMTELKSIINYSDTKSIIIGDEVCKGTEDVSAVAIVGTTINHLINRNAKFIFATHLHKLPYISILKGETKLKIKHISVDFNETTIYSRKLKDGTGDLLYGLEIAHSILKNESFHQKAFSLRNELLNKSSKLVADKKSKYNGNIYINHCQICGEKDNLEAHHIVFQSLSKVRKDRKSNLVVLCSTHHNQVHSGSLVVSGWQSTTEGKMLKYIIHS